MTYSPENLSLWTLPDSYMGAHWDDYFVFLGQHRDSDILTESNFACGLEFIGGESDTVRVVSEGHWAVGWVEWIAIHKSDHAALEQADSLMGALSDYPVLDESDFSEREWESAQEAWESCYSIGEKVDMCRDAGLSIFAARSASIPQGDNGSIYERCLGH